MRDELEVDASRRVFGRVVGRKIVREMVASDSFMVVERWCCCGPFYSHA